MNLLKLGNPDNLITCSNEKCKAVYQWNYEELQFTLVSINPKNPYMKAPVLEYTRVLHSDNWEEKDQMYYCAKCNHLIAISYTTDFEAGQSHLYIPTKE